MHATACPMPDRLSDYLTGKLPPDAIEEIDQHIGSCDACEEAIGKLEQDPDTLVALLRGEETDADDLTWNQHAEGGSDESSIFAEEIASYQLIRKLGSGGMGSVYLARHTKLDKEVAIKLLPKLAGREPEFVARFQREMRAAGKLEHPSIVRTTDAGEHHGVHYLVMEAIDGLDLSQVSRASGHLTIEAACEVVRQAALGLAHAHANGIVHRDVKPSNLMLDGDGKVRILDFGLAQTDLWQKGSAEITTVGQLMGTLDYMAPEQAERGGAVDYRADLYALGATLFRLLTGRAPLAAAPDLTPLEKLRLLSTHSAPRISTLRPEVPRELESLISCLLDRDPAGRPASASHVAEQLDAFAQSQSLPALIADARRNKKLEQDSEDAAGRPELEHVLAASSADSMSNRRNLFWPIIAAGLASMLVFFGILFVVDTAKGQLVIDSKDANLKVTLRKDGKVAKELLIQPGKQSTKLWGGEYEIEIDSPSDRFTVSNEKFSILRGDIVVATIEPKKSSSSGLTPDQSLFIEALQEEPAENSQSSADRRLDEIVYDGETLDTWLRKLQYEKSPSAHEKAVLAILSLATPDLKSLIDPVVQRYVRQSPNYIAGRWPYALRALYKIHKGDLLAFKQVFERDDPQTLNALSYYLVEEGWIADFSEAEREYFVRWALANLDDYEGQTPASYTLLASITRDCADEPAAQLSVQQIAECEAVRPLIQKQLLENLWLVEPDLSGINYDRNWSEPFRKAVIERAMTTLTEDNERMQLLGVITLTSIADVDEYLSKEQRSELTSFIRGQLLEYTQSGDDILATVEIPEYYQIFAGPIIGETHVSSGRTIMPIVFLNLCQSVDGIQEAVLEELKAFHLSIEQRPLYGHRFAGQNVMTQFGRYPDPDSELFEYALFVQSGMMLDIDNAVLQGRFKQMLPADREFHMEAAITRLQKRESSALQYADQHFQTGKNERAEEALVDYFKGNFGNHSSSPLHILARVSGDSFVTRLVEIFKSTPAYVEVSHFWYLREFSSDDPSSLLPLFEWAEPELQKEPVAGEGMNKNAVKVAECLKSLLRDRSAIIEKLLNAKNVITHQLAQSLKNAKEQRFFFSAVRPLYLMRTFGSANLPKS